MQRTPAPSGSTLTCPAVVHEYRIGYADTVFKVGPTIHAYNKLDLIIKGAFQHSPSFHLNASKTFVHHLAPIHTHPSSSLFWMPFLDAFSPGDPLDPPSSPSREVGSTDNATLTQIDHQK